MAKNRLDLNKTINKYMHGPRTTENDYILYPRVSITDKIKEGSLVDMSEDATRELTKAELDPIYIEQSKHNYNSPTNIRKVFITGARVGVQYYGVPVRSKNNGKHYVERAYSGDNAFDYIRMMFQQELKRAQYTQAALAGQKLKEPDTYEISGNGIGVMSGLYTANNIEEIYMDWTFLASNNEDIKKLFGRMAEPQSLYSFMNKSNTFREFNNSVMSNYFTTFNRGNIKNIRNRFPRLKIVAMVSNLDDILKSGASKFPDLRFSNIDEGKRTWYDENIDLIKQSNSITVISRFDAGMKDGISTSDFNLKDSQYKYDYEKLKGLFKSYNERLTRYKSEKIYGKSGTDTKEDISKEDITEAEMGVVERHILDVSENMSDESLKYILKVTVNGMSKSEIKQLFTSFTKDNRQKWAKLAEVSIQ